MAESNTDHDLVLYSYWRSSCSWRVRIALHWFKLPYRYQAINLLAGEQAGEAYCGMNPAGKVPLLQIGSAGLRLTQSMAIIEYLNETHHDHANALLPTGEAWERAVVRQMCLVLVADTQPLQNLSVLRVTPDKEWPARVIRQGLNTFAGLVEKYGKEFSFGERVTMADLCLIPQLYNARRFGLVVEEEFPRLAAIEQRCMALEAFKLAHPSLQPDAPPTEK